ncbi:MAG: DNA internalization-related competence protein ComEC/Rec2 [Gemmatimonadota bacterium]
MNHFRRPLVVALLAYLAGLLTALRFALPATPLVLLSGAILVALLISRGGAAVRRLPNDALLLVLFAASGAVAGTFARQQTVADCRAGLADGQHISVAGTLAAAHRPADRGARPPLLPLDPVRSVEDAVCSEELRVRMPPEQASLRPGAHLEIAGTWRTFTPPLVRSPWPRDPRFLGFLLVDSVRVGPARSGGFGGFALGLRARADERLQRLFPRHIELVEALVLGRREYVSTELRDRFSRAGLSHLLAISGMHVGLLAAAVLLLGSAARLSRRRSIALTLGLTWLYLLVIGAGPSAVRAGIMISLALAASLLQRPAAAAPIVAAAAFVIVATNPLAILDPGFQLSFAGVLGIILLRPPLLTLTPDQLQHRSIYRSAVDAAVVGIAAFIVTAPIVAHHFGIVAPVSMLAGLPAVPVMSLALIGALAALLTEPVLSPLAHLFSAGAALALDLLDVIATLAAALPYGNAAVPRPPWWSWSIAAAAGVGAWRSAASGGVRLRWINGIGATLAVLTVWPLAARGADDRLEIHFIDVGQGDAIAIRTPGRRWLLVDTGPASAEYDAGERRVLPFLRDRGARRIEALVLSHPDLDHIGGAAAVLRGIPTDIVFDPGLAVGKDTYLDLLRGMDLEGTRWRAARSGRTMELDGVRFDFLWPDPETVDVAEDANQISAVLRVTFGDFVLLLTGDVGSAVEDLLVDRHGAALDTDLLKLGHHGSATSTSERFLRVTTPELAIVSAGRRNRYGHPAPAVVERVAAEGIPIARTDREGSVSIEVEGGGRAWRRREW